jgi:LDH2 family malate/lactate/ureidoglycolate dehydrogenase
VVDPDAFMGQGEFRKIAGDISRELRASKKMPDEERIYTPGEIAYYTWLDRKEKGVPVGDTVQKEILAIRDKLGLDYEFPEFEAK